MTHARVERDAFVRNENRVVSNEFAEVIAELNKQADEPGTRQDLSEDEFAEWLRYVVPLLWADELADDDYQDRRLPDRS